jgi:hypothetical protein
MARSKAVARSTAGEDCYDTRNAPTTLYTLRVSKSAHERSECKPGAERERDSVKPQEMAQPSNK